MFYFTANQKNSQQPGYFQKIGLAILTLKIFAFVFGAPLFHMGLWYQTEPRLFALFLLGTVSLGWLIYGIKNQLLTLCKPHPIFYAMLVWGLWQTIVTLASVTSWRSWFGPGYTGMGTGAYWLMILSFILAYPYWQLPQYHRYIIIAAITCLATLCIFHPILTETEWEIENWGDYMAFITAYLWIAILSGKRISNKHYAALIIFSLYALYVSENLSGYAFVSLAIATSTIILGIRSSRGWRRFFYINKKWRALLILACLFPIAWFAISLNISSAISDRHPDPVMGEILDGDGGIGSRIRMHKVSAQIMLHNPSYWLAGNGWGSFIDDSFAHTMIEGVTAFDYNQYKPNWVLVKSTAFHSHNQAIEALTSFGAPGLILWYLIPLLAIATLPRRRFWLCAPMIVAICGAASFWFELPHNMAFQALALVALCSIKKPRITSTPAEKPNHMMLALLCSGAVIMAWSANEQYRAMSYGSKLHYNTSNNISPSASEAQKWLADDLKRDGLRFYQSLMGFIGSGDGSSDSYPAQISRYEWYTHMLYISQKAANTPNVGMRARTSELTMLNNLFLYRSSTLYSKLKPEAKLYLPSAVIQTAHIAPMREDIIAPFLMNLDAFTKDHPHVQLDLLKRLLADSPKHRSALWLLGKKLANSPQSRDIGLDMQKDALKLGVQKVFPISHSELQAFD